MENHDFIFNQYMQEHSTADLPAYFKDVDVIAALRNCKNVIKNDPINSNNIQNNKKEIYYNSIEYIKALKSDVLPDEVDYACDVLKKNVKPSKSDVFPDELYSDVLKKRVSQFRYWFMVKEQRTPESQIKKLKESKWEDYVEEERILRRSIDSVKIPLLLNDKEAFISLPFKDGRLDNNQGLYGTKQDNEIFYKLCEG